MNKKLKISFYSFTSCEGCMMNILIWLYKNFDFFKDNFEINNMKLLTPKTSNTKEDIAIIEGAISSREQQRKVKEIRKKAKIVIAIGTCAITGAPSNNRNFLKKDEEIKKYIKKFNQLEKVKSIKEAIKVDYEVTGCPVIIEEFEKIMHNLVSKHAQSY